MNQFRSTLSEFLIDLRAQKLRAFLTLFGIIWGTVAIVVLMAFGMGFKRQTAVNMHGIGEGIAIMFPGRTMKPWQGFGIGRPMSFVEDDARLISAQVPGVIAISPEYGRRTTARIGENILTPLVSGIYPVYGDMRNIIPEPGGRFLNDPDITERRRVAVIGNRVRDILFASEDPIGRIVLINEVPYTVVGVMQPKTQNSSYNSRDRDRIFIPATTFAASFGTPFLSNIIYQVGDPTQGEAIANDVRAALAKRYKFDPTDEDAVWIWDTTEFDRFSYYFFLGFNLFLGMIGSLTLAVAGLGVANIMFIVVQERIKEIGIRRAVGARRSTILAQFFLETFFIIALGSLIGFAIACGIVALLQLLPIKEAVGTPEISGTVVLATIFVLTIIGLAAGLLPARRASRLDVVDCLRT